MLTEIRVELENCYGIKRLKHTFDFSKSPTQAIYAPNGVMKTSFATTFSDLSADRETSDRIYVARKTLRSITDQAGANVVPAEVFVIEPYNESYKSERISTLLVNKALKERYETIYRNIGQKKETLIDALSKLSGLKAETEGTLSNDFTGSSKELFVAIGRLEREVKEATKSNYSDIVYKKVFNSKVEGFLKNPEFAKKMAEYSATYDKLITNSKFFRKGIFNHNNATVVARQLKDNGWFASGHSVNLKSNNQSTEVKTEAELTKIVADELNAIMFDPGLSKSFDELDGALKANAELRTFRQFINENPFVVPELANIELFKQRIWLSYLFESKAHYFELMEAYDKGRREIASIVDAAKKERTKWLNVIAIFNDRFVVPFKASLENQEDVMLKSDAPNIRFEFAEQGGATVPVDEPKLIEVLSNGEKRALYILNIIFEVEARKEAKQTTLFVVDDLADSFDYKNKYAIVEYLREIALEAPFTMIMLSHNFDFYRTFCSRVNVPLSNKFHTLKSSDGVELVTEKYENNNPFVHWMKNLDNRDMLIGAVPFVRNLAEYCGKQNEFLLLTSILHLKSDTKTLLVSDLADAFGKVLGTPVKIPQALMALSVWDIISDRCKAICLEGADGIELEKKIVLAIGVRLAAEGFMIARINDAKAVAAIKKNQTYKLFEMFKKVSPSDQDSIDVLNRVNIITPENIHLNSFMYEPILDMSKETLKSLYAKVISLNP